MAYEPHFDEVDEIFNGPARKQIAEARKREIETLVNDARSVLETPEGLRIFHWFIERGGIFRSTFTGRALEQAHLDGQRSISAEALSLALKADPNVMNKMLSAKLKAMGGK
jgi:hypothetical protein